MELSIFQPEKENATELAELLNIVTEDLHQKSISQWIYPWKFTEIESQSCIDKIVGYGFCRFCKFVIKFYRSEKHQALGYGATAAHQTLNLWILVRIQVSQLLFVNNIFFQ